MANPTKVTEFTRTSGSVFVNVSPPESVQRPQRAAQYFQDWTAAASGIASDTPTTEPTAVETPPETHPTAEELLAVHLPKHIETTRWHIYITPTAKSSVRNGTVFVYHNPNPAFWNLYNLSKGIFRDLGIRLAKSKGVWEANIPIHTLTDKVFVESGLAGVEATLRTRKDTDSFASRISDSIRHRQFEQTARGIARVKKMREGLTDAAGILVITAVFWIAYIVGGAV